MTAVVTQAGNLKLIAWEFDDDGAEVHRKGDMEAGPASEISPAVWRAT